GSTRLRIYAFVGGSANLLGTTSVGKAVPGETYELKLTGIYESGDLVLTLALHDAEGAELGSLTRTHSAPIAGQWFGLRNRTHSSQGDHVLDIDYHDFRVRAPSELRIAGVEPLRGATFHPASEGVNFTVSTGNGHMIDPSEIELILN